MHTIADPSETAARQWRSRFAAIAWGLSTVALALCASGLTYATAVEVHRLTRTLPSRPPEVVRDVVVRNAPDLKGPAGVVQNPAVQRRVPVAPQLLRRAREHADAA